MTELNDKVKEFIERNIDLIENNEWEEIYKKISKDLFSYEVGEFTTIVLKANINPLDYMSYIPNFYLYNSSISGNFVIPNSITIIEYFAFYGCSGLTSVTIPDSVTSIERNTFQNCSNLPSITIPDSVTSIDWNMFSGCSKLTSITISDSVTRIGRYAFSDCISLTSINIPDNVTSIGNQVFKGCKQLKDIYYGGTKIQWSQIQKAPDWDTNSSINTIHCLDGDIKI